MSAGPFVVGVMGFFSSGTRVGHVHAWILVMRMLVAPDLVQVLLRGFLRASITCSTAPLAGAAAWLGAGEEVGASDGMVAKAFPSWEGFSVIPRLIRWGRRSCISLISAKGDGLGSWRTCWLECRVPSFERRHSVVSSGIIRRRDARD